MNMLREAQEGQNKSWIHANKSVCMAYRGPCVLPMQLSSQPCSDTCVEDGRIQHEISYVDQGSMPSESFELSDVSCDIPRQDVHCVGFPDLAMSASKGSFSRESSRSSFWSSYSSTLSVVSEDKPWECSVYEDQFEDERSSLSSLSSSDESSSCSGEEVSDTHSSYKGALINMLSLKEALPCKRGLSGFFTGKSRSFSCLSDVHSVEDLAKPENPYSKKRKYSSACVVSADRSTESGAVGLQKKAFYSSKHTNLVSAASVPKERYEDEQLNQDERLNRPLRIKKTPRSYSLSDLPHAARQFSHD